MTGRGAMHDSARRPPGGALRAWGRLLRLSLAPSAAADALAGLVYASNGAWPVQARAWWLLPASLCVYHGALAVNDWHDREHDRRTRPTRPIPAGAVSPTAALASGCLAIGAGIACAGLADPRAAIWYAGLAAAALLYDLALRGAWIGPALLGSCRAANLGAGMFLLGVQEPGLSLASFAPALVYGLYVFCVSRLGRLEDVEDERAPLGRAPGVWLLAAACALVGLAGVGPEWRPERGVPLLIALLGALGLARSAWSRSSWIPRDVEVAMGPALRRLLLGSAIVALLAARVEVPDAWIAAALILCGYPLSYALRRSFPPS